MDRTERQRRLEGIIQSHPEWGYKRVNDALKAETGEGYRKQVLLDIKRKVLYKPSPTPKATERTRNIKLVTVRLPNQYVKDLRANGFKDFEIAELLAKKRKLKDGTFIDTTPPPLEGDTFEAMIQSRRKLLKDYGPDKYDDAIVWDYQQNGWTKEDTSLSPWAMFRDFFRRVGGSPGVGIPAGTKQIHFNKGRVQEQKKRYREKLKLRKMPQTVQPSGQIPGANVWNPVTGKAEWKQATWNGQTWVLN